MSNKKLPTPKCPPESFDLAVRSWTGGRLSSRSGYYAGRGVKDCDLNSDHLELLFRGIARDYSPQHAELFVRFVEGLKDLSASAFLTAFQYFFGGGCSDPKCYEQKPGDAYALSGRGDQLAAEAIGCVFTALAEKTSSEKNIEESGRIKWPFLAKHGCQSKENRKSSFYFDH